MNDPIIYKALLGLFVIFFLVAAVLSGKTWKVLHVLLLAGVFIGGGAFFILSALVLNTQATHRSLVDKKKAEIEELQHTVDLLNDGPLVDSAEEDGIRQLKQNLDHVMLERGRLWHGNGKIKGLKATVTIPPQLSTLIKAGMILYAFQEEKDGSYVGEFKVTSATDGKIEMESTIDYDQAETKRLGKLGGAWVLREIMPIDNHLVFEDWKREGKLGDNLPESVVGEYEQDGEVVADVDSDRVRIRVRMTTAVDEIEMADQDTKVVNLKKDDVLLVTPTVAKTLFDKDEAEEIEKVYVRRLRRYEYIFHDIHHQRKLAIDRIAQVNLLIVNAEVATKKSKSEGADREIEKQELQSDKDRLDFETVEVTKYHDALIAQKAKLRASVNNMYRENNRLAKKLAALQFKMGTDIAKRTAAATSN